MSELVSEKELSARLGHKILLAGLAEAGKTATKRIFFLKQSSEDVSKLSATVNYERISVVIKDVPITVIDLGGQKVFLKRFLSIFSPFIFSNVKALIFIIDVSNRSTRNNAVEYFTSCVQKLQTYSPNARYFVLLHKNDLVRHWPNYESIHDQLKEEFQLNSPQKITFFRSTIYNSQTVIDSFGRIIELLFPELARNDLVKGREIGPVEEYAEKFVTHISNETKEYHIPESPSFLEQTPIYSSEYSNPIQQLTNTVRGQDQKETLNNATNLDLTALTEQSPNLNTLQSLMASGLKVPRQENVEEKTRTSDLSTPPSPIKPVTTSQEPILDNIQSLMKSGLISQEPSPPKTNKPESRIPPIQQPITQKSTPQQVQPITQKPPAQPVKPVMQPPAQPVIQKPIDTKNIQDYQKHQPELTTASLNGSTSRNKTLTTNVTIPLSEKTVKTPSLEQEEFNSKINHMIEFYGIQQNEAVEIIKHNYEEVFGVAVISGVPLKLCTKIFLNYIPLIRSQPHIDINALNRTNLINLFVAYSKNAIKEEQVFDYLYISAQSPKLSMIEIKQQIATQKVSNYEIITSKLTEGTQSKYLASRLEEPVEITEKQERLNRLIFTFKGLSLEQANKLLENHLDDAFERAMNFNIPMNEVLDIFLVKLPLLKSKGINVDTIDKQHLVILLDNYSKKRLQQQDFFDCLIISIANPDIPIEEIITTYLSEIKKTIELEKKVEKEQKIQPGEPVKQQPATSRMIISTDNVQVRVSQLLQIANGLQMDDAVKLVELGYDELFSTAISLGYPLDIVIYTLVKIIPKIKAEGLNIQKLDKKRFLEIFAEISKGRLKEEDIPSCLTIAIVRSTLSIDEIIKNYLTKSQVRTLKMQELERIEKEIIPLKQLAEYGFKVELQDTNYSIEFFHKGQAVDKTVVSPAVTVEDMMYLLTNELNLPLEQKSITMNFAARQILEKIKELSSRNM